MQMCSSCQPFLQVTAQSYGPAGNDCWPCTQLFEDLCYSLSHPNCVAFRQFGNKKDGFPRVHINGSITVRLNYSKCPVEERLLQIGKNQPAH